MIQSMMAITADILLSHPETVRPAAPWCVPLGNLELAVLLSAQPWITGTGASRSDLERRVADLGRELPIGPSYFQRVSRTVASLHGGGCLRAEGVGRNRRFVLSPAGFASLILNVQVLRVDPTIDGSEFELKRELVSMWNLLAEQIMASPPNVRLAPEFRRFFMEVDALTIWGRPVMTESVVREAFDVLALVARQRRQVEVLRESARGRLQLATAEAALVRSADLSNLQSPEAADEFALLRDNPELAEMIRSLAVRAMPQLALEARIARYDAYLGYLEQLAKVYGRHLRQVDFGTFRRCVVGNGG